MVPLTSMTHEDQGERYVAEGVRLPGQGTVTGSLYAAIIVPVEPHLSPPDSPSVKDFAAICRYLGVQKSVIPVIAVLP